MLFRSELYPCGNFGHVYFECRYSNGEEFLTGQNFEKRVVYKLYADVPGAGVKFVKLFCCKLYLLRLGNIRRVGSFVNVTLVQRGIKNVCRAVGIKLFNR